MTPYQILKKESKKVGWPKNYKQDLTKHDKTLLNLKNSKGRRFIWILRENGTHLHILDDNKYCDEFITMLKKEGKDLLIEKNRSEMRRFKEWCNDRVLMDHISWISDALLYNKDSNVYVFEGGELTRIKNKQ